MAKLVHVRLADETMREVKEAVSHGSFVSVSDFIREAIREYLERKERHETLRKLVEKKGSWKKQKSPSNAEIEHIRENIFDYL
ncbi:MAG: ribbon-helix-helix protein, CopG family [Candidatus Diapherotrites archaeon]|nr:ribbon-helix-helix protein, CopG family [Candidatus Diapherotrites archaeon]